MRTCMFETCTLWDRDPVYGVSPFVGADILTITKRWKIKETSRGQLQVL